MLENPILNIAFIVAVTSFFKKQFALNSWKALLASFLVSMIIGLVPIISIFFPEVAPWLAAVANVIVLFLSAAGSFDLIMEVRTTVIPPKPGL